MLNILVLYKNLNGKRSILHLQSVIKRRILTMGFQQSYFHNKTPNTAAFATLHLQQVL